MASKVKLLRPQPLKESDYDDMRKQLELIFYKLIFKPIVDLLSPYNAQVKKAAKELRNAIIAPVVSGIKAGRIQYVKNTFSGDFNAEISKALKSYGANYNKRLGTYTILPQDLPVDVLAAVNEYAEAAKALHDELDKQLGEIQIGLEGKIKANPVDAKKTIGKLDKKFKEAYEEAIGAEELSDRAVDQISKDYTNNMELWIQKWSEETIKELRGAVQENASEGYRFDHLIDRIQNRYDVSKTKATFLARQETSLFVSKHRQGRFEDAGITSYIWQTAGDTNVREDHKHLNGREFKFSEPPIIDKASGMRGNPGEGYNCRCVADPVLPGVLANA